MAAEIESDMPEFCLRWNNHHTVLVSVLDSLLTRERLTDVTLAAEGQFLNVHRLVLFACSQYFEDLLNQQPDKPAVVFLKDVRYTDLKSLVDYMYKGEVNVAQDQLSRFLETAEALKIRGLVEKESHKESHAKVPSQSAPTHKREKVVNEAKVQKRCAPTSAAGNSPVPRKATMSPLRPGNSTSTTESRHTNNGGEMEAGDHFLAVNPKNEVVFDSDVEIDDQFEATENWSLHDDDDDEGWSNSQDATNATSGGNDTYSSNFMALPTAECEADNENQVWTSGESVNHSSERSGPSQPVRKRSATAERGAPNRIPQRRRGEFALDRHNANGRSSSRPEPGKKPITLCSCGRSFAHYSNYKRHKTFECGKEAMFACHFENCHSRFKRKDSLVAHCATVHRCKQ